MKFTKWNDNWKFWEEKDAFALLWRIPEEAADVNLPHDAMLERKAYEQSPNAGNTGFRDGGVYSYGKYLSVSEEDKNQTWMLKFNGVYMNAFVYVNGQLAADCPCGYTGFYVPLNDYLIFGKENEIRVTARNSGMPNSRWYSGSGIYQDVYLLSAGERYIVPGKVKVLTENIGEGTASLKASLIIKNRKGDCAPLSVKIAVKDNEGRIAAETEKPFVIFAGEEREIYANLAVEDPKLWSADTPDLYTYEITLLENGKAIDAADGTFGIRTLAVDAKKGLRINGVTTKLRGGCVHHDCGILGAASYYDFEYRRVKILKEAGFNAIRSSHQPATENLLKACDELGLYIMEEFSDMWTRAKTDNDYVLSFSGRWAKDVHAMVEKDINHPSVIMYSVGNEIPDIGMSHGSKLCADISKKIKDMDPSRPTLACVNGSFAVGDAVGEILADILPEFGEDAASGNVNDFMTVLDAHLGEFVVHDKISERLDYAFSQVDIAGYNYMTARYEKDAAERPDRVIVGSETYPPQIPENWEYVKNNENIIGDFTWTGWDYIGEAGVGVPAYNWGEGGFGAAFPCQLAYVGDIDITGFRRPASYFRQLVWGLAEKPYICVQNPEKYGQFLIKTPWVISDAVSSWTFPGYEGKPVVAEVYSAGDEIELILNGRSLGRQTVQADRTLFETVYEPGTLEAVSYINGSEVSRAKLVSAKESSLTVNLSEGNSKELIFAEIAYADENGTVDTAKNAKIEISASGNAQVWIGSGDPKPEDNYIDGRTKLWNGRALAIIRKNTGESVKLTVSSGKESLSFEI